MGMTDSQFKQFCRMQLRFIKEAKEEESKEETDKKLENIIEDLQKGLED
ncbi:MAG: hypothetical protein FWF50_03030 [Defluviitaleaceae bacterium]|nr:hypothetical protein [Defluviitaleaceae bacterium]